MGPARGRAERTSRLPAHVERVRARPGPRAGTPPRTACVSPSPSACGICSCGPIRRSGLRAAHVAGAEPRATWGRPRPIAEGDRERGTRDGVLTGSGHNGSRVACVGEAHADPHSVHGVVTRPSVSGPSSTGRSATIARTGNRCARTSSQHQVGAQAEALLSVRSMPMHCGSIGRLLGSLRPCTEGAI